MQLMFVLNDSPAVFHSFFVAALKSVVVLIFLIVVISVCIDVH